MGESYNRNTGRPRQRFKITKSRYGVTDKSPALLRVYLKLALYNQMEISQIYR